MKRGSLKKTFSHSDHVTLCLVQFLALFPSSHSKLNIFGVMSIVYIY